MDKYGEIMRKRITMDLSKIKQKADEEKAIQIEIEKMKKEAIEKFDAMFAKMKNSYNLWNAKMKVTVDKFIEAYKEYFMTNGFKIQVNNPFVKEALVGGEIIATYETAIFKLSGINYDGEHMYIQNFDENLCIEFWISLPKSVPNYLVWKDNVNVSGKDTSQYGNNAIEGYKDFVNSFNTIKELTEVINKIEINIRHFSEATERINDIELIIHKFGTDTEYKDFKELWDSVE